VDEHYDTGKTLAQRVVPVFADDTPELLASRVLHEVKVQPYRLRQLQFKYSIDTPLKLISNTKYLSFPCLKSAIQEHQVYVEAVAALCEDRIVWREDGVPLIKSRLNPDVYL